MGLQGRADEVGCTQGMSGNHTIILRQQTNNKKSRTYEDFPSERAAMDGICRQFESELKKLNPSVRQLSYSIDDLFRYIDSLGDLCAMTFNPRTSEYRPHDKKWVKDKVFAHMKAQAGR